MRDPLPTQVGQGVLLIQIKKESAQKLLFAYYEQHRKKCFALDEENGLTLYTLDAHKNFFKTHYQINEVISANPNQPSMTGKTPFKSVIELANYLHVLGYELVGCLPHIRLQTQISRPDNVFIPQQLDTGTLNTNLKILALQQEIQELKTETLKVKVLENQLVVLENQLVEVKPSSPCCVI